MKYDNAQYIWIEDYPNGTFSICLNTDGHETLEAYISLEQINRLCERCKQLLSSEYYEAPLE